MDTLTKADLVDRVVARLGLTRRESIELVDELFEQMRVCFDRGEDLKIPGFGNFEVREKRARTGRDFGRETSLTIPARRVLVFKPSARFRARLNADQDLR